MLEKWNLEFSWHRNGEDDEHNGIGFVEISEIFAFFFGTAPFDRVDERLVLICGGVTLAGSINHPYGTPFSRLYVESDFSDRLSK